MIMSEEHASVQKSFNSLESVSLNDTSDIFICLSYFSCLLQDVILKIVRREGIPALWKGFTPCYLRIGPHTVLTFIFLEQFNVAVKKFYGVPV